MSSGETPRVLIVAPIGRDADLMCTYLTAAGIACEVRGDVDTVCNEVNDGAGALLFTEEALNPDVTPRLARVLDNQEAWSDVPLIILMGEHLLDAPAREFLALGRRTNVTFVDRPVRIKSLVSAAQSALRARQRQYQIRDLMKTLEDRVHERDRFLAILGHELRNPLGAILLASQMTGDDGKLEGEHAQLIERQSKHLTRLVNDLLDLSRVVSGKIVLKKQVIDVAQALRQSIETINPAAERQHVTIEVRQSSEPLPVEVDPVRVDQIITNVLTNAIKYTPEGGHVVVTLARERGQAVMRVKDNGVGIAPDRIGTIFELFAQAENAIGRAQGGMGIGLALVRNLLQLHGGTISAHSDGVGKGSEFTVTFPLAMQNTAGVVAQNTAPRKPSARQSRRIVIVEDNADVRALLRLKLRRLGHTVEAAADGPDGVKMIVEQKPDLALVDIGLPGFDGYEVATQVRQSLGDDVVLVAVSGFGQPEDKRKALDAGFNEHITKPADVSDIDNLLARFPPQNPADGV
ncbi:MAG TPA: hybrid sensor histidine kinase/response regulator [Thermoanaerobaculia bacterium]|nr:hybrid sensor histidine kinase/response regulator [Thermoanaerobaculia bacterium]